MSGTLSGDYTVVGNRRVYAGLLTIGATSISAFVYVPGMKTIKAAIATPVSGTTCTHSLHYNVATDGTATNGMLGITSCLASNIYGVVVFGT